MKSFIKTIVFSLVLAAGIVSMTVNADAKDAEGNVVIVIDPGHGGEDPGAQAVTGAFEDECNYIIAMAMKNELCKYDGVKVYLTREADSWITNTGRAMIAAGLKADFLISLHNNSGSSTNTGALAYRSLIMLRLPMICVRLYLIILPNLDLRTEVFRPEPPHLMIMKIITQS